MNQESVTTFKINDLWTASMQKIMATQAKFENQVQSMQSKAGKAFDGVKSKVENFKVRNIEAIEAVSGQIPGLAGMGPMLANPYVAGAAAVGSLAVGIIKATKYAQEWETKMAQVNVTANLGKKELKGLSDELLNIGKRNVAPLEEVPEAFNKILSAGLDVNTSLNALEPTLRAAKAGFTDMATTAAAGVGVMNASGENINRVYDVLFATMNVGNAEFKDIAAYLPKIVPAARAAGFSLHEVGGAWAYLTGQGLTAERSTTLMENAFKSLTNPDRVNAFNKMGVAIFDSNGKMLPMIKIIEQLSGKMDGLTDKQRIAKLAALGLDMEAASAFSSMTQNVDKLRDSIDFTTNSTGQLNEAYKNAAQSGDAWAVISNKFKVIWVKIGEKFLPLLDKAGKWVLKIIDGFEDLNSNSLIFKDTLSVLGDVFSFFWENGTRGIRLFIGYWERVGNVISWVSDKLGLAGSSGEGFYYKMRPYLIWIYDMFGKISGIAYKVMTGDFKGAWEGIKNFKLPSLEEIQEQQAKEIAKMSSKVKINDTKNLNPQVKALGGLDLDGMDGGKTKKGKTPEGSISGGGIKSITINIQHLLSGVTVNATTIKEGAQDITKLIQEEMLKMIADTSATSVNG
jgi:TP901 family phage tail tape measure protein